ncbi:Z1 domain-containing protein [Lentzea sp. NPDC042327]|uniref:Z1 domain-containing protein n=1 Tax=Lentzea sp. NPDC042327 TaxID=3154801 RepID=UPI0033D007C6
METLVEESNNPYGVHAALWRWNPRIDGSNFARFLEASGLPDDAKEQLRSFTPRVLGQCSPPQEDGRSTGLVIGKVQSGKTNSFLALSALASDNGYRLIILLSGTKNILKSQTYRQVVSKLSRGDRSWKVFNFEPGANDLDFDATLQTALSPVVPRTLVVTILKRTRAGAGSSAEEGIHRLVALLKNSTQAEELRRQPVLIIDDEADEASLDNSAHARRNGRLAGPTTTNTAINRLTDLFDRHAFIQYTATPQANLLVELTENLSPDFCELLPPGAGYCGAEEFFPPDKTTYWVEIPPDDVAAVDQQSDQPPVSLKDAIRFFFVGSALEELTDGGNPKTRSMLVHPHRLTPSHELAQRWVQNIVTWLRRSAEHALLKPKSYLAEEFYEQVTATLGVLDETVSTTQVVLHDLTSKLLQRLHDTEIRVINSRKAAEDIGWEDTSSWIFVGGDVLQRGFAFQGLTTTWMSRGPGTGQVDVLMQRGRFFGYRRDYLPYCRIWLPRGLYEDHYALFARHETTLWRSVRNHIAKGLPMTAWSRMFWLDPGLSLCRRTSQWFRMRPVAEWLSQTTLPCADEADEAARNAALVQDLRDSVQTWQMGWTPPNGEPARKHRFAEVPLKQLADFISSYRFFGGDEVDHAVIEDLIAHLRDEEPDAVGIVVDMRPERRARRSTRNGRVSQIFQGRGNDRDPASLRFYPGDREFRAGGEGIPQHSDDLLTIQLHDMDLTADGVSLTGPGGYLHRGCPMLTAWLPEDMRSYRRQT